MTTPNFGEASYDAGRLLPRLMRHRFPRTGILSPELTVEDGPFTDVSLYFSRGLADAGVDFPDDWFLRARLADLPALCELLTREDVPDAVVAELHELMAESRGNTAWLYRQYCTGRAEDLGRLGRVIRRVNSARFTVATAANSNR